MQAANLQRAEQERIREALVSNAATDYKGALAATQSLSNERIGDESDLETPRCAALLEIAESVMNYGNYSAVKEALRELIGATGDLPPISRANYLVHAAALSAQMDDNPGAQQELDLAMKAAAQLYQEDAFGDSVNTAPKNRWPSTVAWKASCVVASRVNPDYGIAQTATIPDPEIEAVVKMAVAAAILGHPSGDSQITIRRGRDWYVTYMEIPWWILPADRGVGHGAASPYRVAQ